MECGLFTLSDWECCYFWQDANISRVTMLRLCKCGASNFITSTRGEKLPILLKTEIQRIANHSFYKGKAFKKEKGRKIKKKSKWFIKKKKNSKKIILACFKNKGSMDSDAGAHPGSHTHLLGLLRHKNHSSAHPKTITEQSEREERGGRQTAVEMLHFTLQSKCVPKTCCNCGSNQQNTENCVVYFHVLIMSATYEVCYCRRGGFWSHMQWVQSHIMGGRSSSSSQMGIFRGSSFTFVCLSSTTSSTLSSALCLFNSMLQVLVAAGLMGGVCDGGQRGGTLETEVWGIVTSLCGPSSSCCFLRSALTGREGSLEEGGWGAACTEATVLKFNDKAEINGNYHTNLDHVTQKPDQRGWITHEHLLESIKNF